MTTPPLPPALEGDDLSGLPELFKSMIYTDLGGRVWHIVNDQWVLKKGSTADDQAQLREADMAAGQARASKPAGDLSVVVHDDVQEIP